MEIRDERIGGSRFTKLDDSGENENCVNELRLRNKESGQSPAK